MPAGFSLVGTFPADVPAGGSVSFSVQFDAAAAGAAGGTLSFSVPGAAGAYAAEIAAAGSGGEQSDYSGQGEFAPAAMGTSGGSFGPAAMDELDANATGFTGDTTSFAYQPYAWPDAPPDLPDPSVGNALSGVPPTATSPVPAPTFDGISFDPTQSALYTATIAADEQTYNTAVVGADTSYESDVSAAAGLQSQALDTAKQIEQQAFATADQDYETALDEENPTDLTAAQNTLSAADEKAKSDYHDKFIKANGTFLIADNGLYETYLQQENGLLNQLLADYKAADQKMNARISSAPEGDLGEQVYEDALHGYDVDRANADVKFAKQIDAAVLDFSKAIDSARAAHDDTVADALQTELKAFNDAQLVYAKAYLEYERWNTAHPIDAEQTRQLAYNQAERDYAVAQAQAAQGYHDAVALAAQNRDDEIAGAAQTQETGDAAALVSAAQTYLSSVGNALSGVPGGDATANGYTLAWAGYQFALATDEAGYETKDAVAQDDLAEADALAAYNDATNVDAANETRDETIANDAQTVADAQTNADHDWRVGRAQDDKDQAVNNNVAANAAADGWVDADHTYNLVSIDAWHTLSDAQSEIGIDYFNNIAGAEAAYIASDDYATEQNTLASLAHTFLTAIGGTYRDDGYTEVAASLVAATTQDRLGETDNNAVADDLDAWQKQNDTLLGAAEITIGTALANQDQLDTAARDTADETAANEAAGEAGADALAEQTYNDTDAADQSSQDISDVAAQQTMEESEADGYSSAMQAWSTSVGNALRGVPGVGLQASGAAASAEEQYQQASADDAWIYSVTTAQVTDATAEDGLQVAWTTTVDAAAALEQTDDADAIAAAIVSADEADAAEAVARDGAWTTEVNNLAGAVTTYDSAAADAADREANRQDSALYDVRHADDEAQAAYGYALADAIAENYAGLDNSAGLVAAQAAQKQAIVSAGEAWATLSIGIVTDYVSDAADAKVAWVKGVTDAEAGYTAAAATASAANTTADALAAATMDGTLAGDEAAFELSQEAATITLDGGDGTQEESLVHAEDTADATDEVAYAQAGADFLVSIWNNYAASVGNALSGVPPGTPESALRQYYANLATIEASEISTDGADLVSEETEITGDEVTLGDEEEAASVAETNNVDLAQQSEMSTLLPEEVQAVEDADADLAGAVGNDADAQAAYQTSVANAAAKYFQDKADAARDCDNALAAAGAAKESALVAPLGDLVLGTKTREEVNSIAQAATDQFGTDLKAAYAAVYAGYGDAEITEAGSVGDAEIALATAQGGDEVTLATEEAGAADALADEETSADATYTGAVGAAATTESEAEAADTADWTSSTGSDQTSTEAFLAGDEVSDASAAAGAAADYAITMAQLAANAASAAAQGSPSNANTFAAEYAQGYVTWLTALKQAYVDKATASAQGDVDDRQALVAAEVDVANQQASANVTFVNAESPDEGQQSISLASATDGYHTASVANYGNNLVATATADETQAIALANAAATYMLSSAKADKDHAVNGYNDVPDTNGIFNNAIADARLVLADSQADADLAWIQGKAVADNDYSTADAEAWQGMSESEVTASDQFAHEYDAASETFIDGVVGAEDGALVAKAEADQADGNATATAEGNFQVAEANETAAVWATIVDWASPTSGNPDGLPGLPWIQSQAGLAGALAGGATDRAVGYEQYIASAGADEVQYAATDAAQLTSELQSIFAEDRSNSDEVADTDEGLTGTLVSDEAASEISAASGGMEFQDDEAQGDHDCRQAIALADHDLAVGGSAADYAAAVAAADAARSQAYASADQDFIDIVSPALTLQGVNDADAEQLEADANAANLLAEALRSDVAAHDYAHQQAADLDIKQRGDADALDHYLLDDAYQRAETVAIFAAANPSPWADDAMARALAQAALSAASADAALAERDANADADEGASDAEADAIQTRDDANAQTDDNEALSAAAAASSAAVARAQVADTVFSYLPGALAAPDDGPTPTISPDFKVGYEANEFYLALSHAGGDQASVEFVQGNDPGGTDPHFMPTEMEILPAYEWSFFGDIIIPMDLTSNPSPALTFGPYDPSTNAGYDKTDTTGGVTPIQTPAGITQGPDYVRGVYPLPLDYTPAMHMDGAAELLTWGGQLTLPGVASSPGDAIMQWKDQTRQSLVQLTAYHGQSGAGSSTASLPTEEKPKYGPPAPVSRDELEAQARKEAIDRLVQQVYMDGLVAQLRPAMADDPAYKQLMSRLENDERIAPTDGGAKTRSAEERLAIELGYFYGALQGQIAAIHEAKSSFFISQDEYYRLNNVERQLEDVQRSIKTAYESLGLNDVVVRGIEAGADANRSTVGTGIKNAASAANNILLWGNNSIESTGDEGFIVDAAALLGKGVVQGVGRGAMRILSRFATSHLDDIGRIALSPAVKAVKPTVTQILQNLVDDAVAQLVSNPAVARTVLKDSQYKAAQTASGMARQFGNAVEELVDRAIRSNPALSELFVRAGKQARNGRWREIWDFSGIGRGQGLIFDITTNAAVGRHRRERFYGQLVDYITYDIPQGFKFP